jgi:hypothetical protein
MESGVTEPGLQTNSQEQMYFALPSPPVEFGLVVDHVAVPVGHVPMVQS